MYMKRLATLMILIVATSFASAMKTKTPDAGDGERPDNPTPPQASLTIDPKQTGQLIYHLEGDKKVVEVGASVKVYKSTHDETELFIAIPFPPFEQKNATKTVEQSQVKNTNHVLITTSSDSDDKFGIDIYEIDFNQKITCMESSLDESLFHTVSIADGIANVSDSYETEPKTITLAKLRKK